MRKTPAPASESAAEYFVSNAMPAQAPHKIHQRVVDAVWSKTPLAKQ
jgi:hypothetical protein